MAQQIKLLLAVTILIALSLGYVSGDEAGSTTVAPVAGVESLRPIHGLYLMMIFYFLKAIVTGAHIY